MSNCSSFYFTHILRYVLRRDVRSRYFEVVADIQRIDYTYTLEKALVVTKIMC